MTKYFQRLFLIFLLISNTSCQKANDQVFNILDFGAVPDGKTLNTKAIQLAVDKALKEGGTVKIPEGTFVTGAIVLGPNITVQLDEGAVLLASGDMKDYPNNHFISAPYADNLKLIGHGTINGNGTAFFTEEWKFSERPQPWIVISDAKNVLVRGIHLENSPSHVLNLNFCQNVLVDSVSIKNDPRSPNTDGIDIRNSKDVTVTNCDIRTGDDAICLKVTSKKELWYDPKGNARPRTVENVLVRDCYIESDDSALKLGTGSGHLTQNVTFENITIRKTRYGMALFMMDGGLYKNIRFKDIDVETGARHSQEYGIFMDIHQRLENSPVGQIEDIRFENCQFNTKGIFYLSGHPQQRISNIVLKDIGITLSGTLDTSKWKKPKGNRKVKDWPSTADFVREKGRFIVAHAEDLTLENIRVQNPKNDDTPFFWSQDTTLDTLNIKILPQ